MRTLLVDNHDSYTYNVFHLLAGVTGEILAQLYFEDELEFDLSPVSPERFRA